MAFKIKLTIDLIAICMLLAACNTISQPPHAQARTFYESLDLESSEAAVRTFIDAFQRADFPTVYWILAPDAQDVWRQYMSMLEADRVIKVNEGEDAQTVFHETMINTDFTNIGQLESFGDTSYYFDIVMYAAKQHGVLPIDLTHAVTIREVKPPQRNDQYTFVDVTVETDTVDGIVIFRTIQGPSGRWRVLQVIVPGGDERDMPWSIPRAER